MTNPAAIYHWIGEAIIAIAECRLFYSIDTRKPIKTLTYSKGELA